MQNWKKAGEITARAIDYGKSLIKEDTKIIDILDKIEDFIKKEGGNPAFPAQVSINSIAAHQTAIPNDETALKEGDLAKLDLGVEIDGYIGDSAITIEINTSNQKELIKASEEALKSAIKLCIPGTELREIGKAIEDTIHSHGFNPIRNLSGHEIKRYTLHSGLTVPNHDDRNKTKLEKEMVLAIEPFATPGTGRIKEGKPSTIYRLDSLNPVRNPDSRIILNYVSENHKTLPFCKRQLARKFSLIKVNLALIELERCKVLYQYPVLPEVSGALVSQAEHTVMVDEKPVVLTRI